MKDSAKGIIVFLLVTFGLAWSVWEVPLWLGVPATSTLMRLLVIPGAFAPAVAAVVVRRWVTCEGFADAGLEPHPRNWRFYVAAWLVPLAAVAFVAWAAPFFGLADPQIAKTLALGSPIGVRVEKWELLARAVFGLTLIAAISTPILWGEEFGWRSYLQLRLFPNRPLLAAVSTGLIWGVWHYPLLFSVPEIPQHAIAMLAIFPAGTVLYSILFGWLRIRSNSIWPSSFAHSCINNIRSPLISMLFASAPDKLPFALLGLLPMLVFVGAVVLAGGLKARTAQ